MQSRASMHMSLVKHQACPCSSDPARQQTPTLSCVRSQVMPVLLSVVRTSDDALRLYLLKSLTELVSVLRQHVRKYLGDLMALVHHYWASGSQLLPVILTLVSEIAGGTLPVTTGVVRS